MSLRNLIIITTSLFIGSLAIYYQENKRGDSLVRGSELIKGLDLAQVQRIKLSFPKEESITFDRDGNRFVLGSHKSFPADIVRVNDLIFKISTVEVDRLITTKPTEEDLKKYGLNPEDRLYHVEIFDDKGNRTVSFSVGKHDEKQGTYVQKEGGSIYLSKEGFFVGTSYRSFIRMALLNVRETEIERVEAMGKAMVSIAREQGRFQLTDQTNKALDKEKTSQYVSGVGSLMFLDFFSPQDPKVQGITFDHNVKVTLKNKVVYQLGAAKYNNEYFLKISALVDEMPESIEISRNDSKEKIKGVEDMMKAQGRAQRFNLDYANWVYKINQATYERLLRDKQFLMGS